MFDVIVIGGGPAGLSAALMLGRCRRHVLLCDAGQPRNRRSLALHGYLTRDGIVPAHFNDLGRKELRKYGVEFRCVAATRVDKLAKGFRVRLADGRIERSRFLLIATGVVDKLPELPGFDECYGRSVFHCPYCDGWEWRDRPLAVFGRGRSAADLALGLRTWSRDLLLCSHGTSIEQSLRERLIRNGITIRTERVAELVHKKGVLSAVRFVNNDAVPRTALFFTTAQYHQSDLASRVGCLMNRRGTVKTGTLSDTNIPGVFVAGDASRDAQFVVIAAGEGVKAAMAINRALQRSELVA